MKTITALASSIAGMTAVISQAASFGEDVALMKKHTEILTLRDEGTGAAVALAPAYQGRVMTSSLDGDKGMSFGWINPAAIEEGVKPEGEREGIAKHIHLFGGEERFWLGPEGGQFAVFFPKDAPAYEFEHWKTPAFIDTDAYDVLSKDARSVVFGKAATVTNRAGTKLKMKVERTISLLDGEATAEVLPGGLPDGLDFVAFRSDNKLTNTGDEGWTREKGLPSIWLLGMLKHSDRSNVAIPVKEADVPAVRSDYFGEVGKDRLIHKDGVVFFKADGRFRSKIGIPAARATPFAGSYDPTTRTLTLIHYNLPADASGQPYVRSQWEEHEDPYAGDVINAYNDGPTEPGGDPLGPFYELESSSPALALRPGESFTHSQTTMHFKGPREALDRIARATLKCDLAAIEGAFD